MAGSSETKKRKQKGQSFEKKSRFFISLKWVYTYYINSHMDSYTSTQISPIDTKISFFSNTTRNTYHNIGLWTTSFFSIRHHSDSVSVSVSIMSIYSTATSGRPNNTSKIGLSSSFGLSICFCFGLVTIMSIYSTATSGWPNNTSKIGLFEPKSNSLKPRHVSEKNYQNRSYLWNQQLQFN